ncbi:MAG: CCA tRNA nucleotidyltransferase [Candidatus Bathyarchaeia archaeon]
MSSKIEQILKVVLTKIVPKDTERSRVLKLSQRIIDKVSLAARRASLDVEVSLEGSVAKDTWLSGEADIDIFLKVDSNLDKNVFETTCLEVAKDAVREHNPIARFADHPYIEAFIGKSRIDIVPCYKVEKGMWKSATDRTPYHTQYVKHHLDQELRNEVRLLKRFMKGTGTYGAEVKVGGFSGMLCEILILHYGSLLKTFESAAGWKEGTVIDVENHYRGDVEEIRDLFDHPLIVIDPVDKARNIASAVRHERLWEFVSASRAFLNKPSLDFFYPRGPRGIGVSGLKRKLETRGTCIVGIKFGRINAPVDVFWSQIYKAEKCLTNLLRSKGFSVVRTLSFSDEEHLNLIIFELEMQTLPKTMKQLGPTVERRIESEKFLLTHLESSNTVSGPWIEKDRWAILKVRRHADAEKVLKAHLADGGRNVGVPTLISDVIKRGEYTILVDNQIGKCLKNKEFAEFMSKYLAGRPPWLK